MMAQGIVRLSRIAWARWLFCACILAIFCASPAFAHRLMVDAYADGDSVYARGYMDDGRACRSAAALLQTGAGETLAQGMTDGDGRCAFARPEASDLKVVIYGEMGHRGEAVVVMGASREKVPAPADLEMGQIVDGKLAPLVAAVAQLREAQERAGFRDVIGGIGYIVGLVGVGMYFLSRKGR